MVQKASKNPYETGFGTMPRYLAGRDRVCQDIDVALDIIIEPRGPDNLLSEQPRTPIVLIGPRGVGKTALVAYADKQAAKLGIPSILINKAMLEDDTGYLYELLAPNSIGRSIVKKLKSVGISKSGVKDNLDLRQSQSNISLNQAFRDRLLKGPLLLILDEVHTYQGNYLSSLFVIIQELIMKSYPIAVIMSGAPGTMELFHSCGASFVERSNVQYLNILDKEATQVALAEPAKQSGLPLAADALELLVENSDYYPYFIQVLGKEAWNIANEAGHSEITLADAKQGLTLAQQTTLSTFYSGRYSELRERQLLEYAIHTIRWMHEAGGTISTIKLLNNFIKHDNMDMTKALEIYNELITLGFIWEDNLQLEPSIPSLFSFIDNQMAEA